MKRLLEGMAIAMAVALAAPAWAQTAQDAKDTANQKTHETKKAAREHKPGGETVNDKANDAGDTAKAKSAQAKKKARKAGRSTKHSAHRTQRAAKRDLNNATK